LVSDYEVNQTGTMPVVNASVEIIPTGLRAEARPRMGPDGKFLRIDLRIEEIEATSVKERPSAYFGEFDLPRIQQGQMGAVVVLRPGTAAIAGEIGASAGDEGKSFACIIRAAAQGTGARPEAGPAPPAEDGIRVLPPPFSSFPAPRFPHFEDLHAWSDPSVTPAFGPFSPGQAQESSDPIATLPDAVAEAAIKAFEDDEGLFRMLQGGTAAVAAGSARFLRVAGEVLEARDDGGRMAAIDLRLLRFPRAALGTLLARREGGGGILDVGWEGTVHPDAVELRCFLAGLPGQAVACRRDRAETLVTDVVLVSGGTGYSLLTVPDPVSDRLSSGFAFVAEARDAGGGEVEIVCRGILARTDTSNRSVVRMPLSGGSGPGTEPAGKAAPQGLEAPPAMSGMAFVDLEVVTPRQEIRRIEAHVRAPAGRDVILDLSARGEVVEVLVGSARIVTP